MVNPEYGETRREPKADKIIDASPLLKVFFDKTLMLQQDAWKKSLAKSSQDILIEIEDNLDERWQERTLPLLIITAKNLNVFQKFQNPQTLVDVVKTLVLAGHEIKDTKNVPLFLPEILNQLNRLAVIKPHITWDPKYREVASGTVTGLLEAGIYIRALYDSPITDDPRHEDKREPEKIELAEPFRKFIEEMPFDL